MLWLVIGGESHQIISCNIAEFQGAHTLWVTRPNGKNLKVYEGSAEEAQLRKDAIDHAIEVKESTLRL